MAVETTLPEEVETLEGHARAIARDVLGPDADRAEHSGAWDEASVRAFDQLDVRSLWLPADCGGAADPLAAVVALDALATGGAGGLALADQPGPASGALWVLPDRDRARETARSSLGARAVVAVGVTDAVGDVGPGSSVSWAPGGGPPATLVVAARDGVTVVDGAQVRAEPVDATALWASGGVRLAVAHDAAVEAFPLDAAAALVARGVPRLWSGALLCGVGQASLDYAVTYGRERIVFGLPVLGHQANAFEVAWATATLEGARIALRGAASHLAAGRLAEAGWLATLAWLEAREAALRATDLGVQLLGGHGYIHDHPCHRWYREARMLALLFGGEDAALDDIADRALDAPDPLVA